MLCPTCGKKTKVIDSRLANSRAFSCIADIGEAAIGWYTSDWRMRVRTCEEHGRLHTVEVYVDDLESMFKEKDRTRG